VWLRVSDSGEVREDLGVLVQMAHVCDYCWVLFEALRYRYGTSTGEPRQSMAIFKPLQLRMLIEILEVDVIPSTTGLGFLGN